MPAVVTRSPAALHPQRHSRGTSPQRHQRGPRLCFHGGSTCHLQSGAGGQGWPRILPGLELTSPSPQVQQYRVAMTAKDCSVMIALSPCLQDAR